MNPQTFPFHNNASIHSPNIRDSLGCGWPGLPSLSMENLIKYVFYGHDGHPKPSAYYDPFV